MNFYILLDARLVKRTPLYGKTTSNPLVVYPRPKRNSCPFEYTNTGMSCVWAVEFPARPVHIAEIECQVCEINIFMFYNTHTCI